jgi:hypothetical protein
LDSLAIVLCWRSRTDDDREGTRDDWTRWTTVVAGRSNAVVPIPLCSERTSDAQLTMPYSTSSSRRATVNHFVFLSRMRLGNDFRGRFLDFLLNKLLSSPGQRESLSIRRVFTLLNVLRNLRHSIRSTSLCSSDDRLRILCVRVRWNVFYFNVSSHLTC